MIESKQALPTRGALAGLLLFVAACTLSTEDIPLNGIPAGEGGRGDETSDGVGGNQGGGVAGRSDSPADAGALGGSGGVARGMGGNTGGAAGTPGAGGSVPQGTGSGGGTPELPPSRPTTDGAGGSGGASGSGGSAPPASGGLSGMTGSEGPPSTRAKSFDFETGTQGWQDIKGAGAEVTRSTERAWSGSASLEVSFATKKADVEKARYIGVLSDQTPLLMPGQTIRFHFYIPSGKDSSALFALQPFAISQGGLWQGNFKLADPLAHNTWIDFDLTLPNDYDTQDLLQFGVQALTREDGTRVRFFVDGVTF